MVSYQGQEDAQVGATFAWTREKAYVLLYYRALEVVQSSMHRTSR